ncbi:MAG: hypothetical protein LDL44_20490 [Caenispirillum sp.]|nr:hypothetical protein [Caenispirillum sp.]
MTFIDTASALDPSTALGAVLGWLVTVFPARGEPLDIGLLVQTGACVWFLAFAALMAMTGHGPTVAAVAGTVKGVVAVSGLWVVFILAADAYLAAGSLPRLSAGALTFGPALLAGAIPAGLLIGGIKALAVAVERLTAWDAKRRRVNAGSADPC